MTDEDLMRQPADPREEAASRPAAAPEQAEKPYQPPATNRGSDGRDEPPAKRRQDRNSPWMGGG